MLLKSPFVRRGIAFLEPGNVEMKYHETEERQAVADEEFERDLLVRMGCVLFWSIHDRGCQMRMNTMCIGNQSRNAHIRQWNEK